MAYRVRVVVRLSDTMFRDTVLFTDVFLFNTSNTVSLISPFFFLNSCLAMLGLNKGMLAL